MWDFRSNLGADVFDQLDRMHREMDHLFGNWAGGPASIRAGAASAYPQINVGAAPDRIDVYAFAPGMDPKSLDISMQQSLLTIIGERQVEEPDNAKYYRKERFTGSFHRVISLPDDVNPDKVDATYRDGVLHIAIQRREEVKPRKVEVK